MKPIAFVATILLASGALADPDPAPSGMPVIPKPPEIDKLHALAAQIGESSGLPSGAKALVKKQMADIDAEFDKAWQPVQGALDHATSLRKENDRAVADLLARKQLLITRRDATDPKDEGGLKSVNADIDTYNHDLTNYDEKVDRERQAIQKEMTSALGGVAELFTRPAVQDFERTGRALLEHRVTFRQGMAWRQLNALAADPSAAQASRIYDGSSAVDARDVPKMSAEERKKAQAAPAAQLPKSFRTKAKAPPPPPPSDRP